jgi:hypothetical protein
LPVQGVLDFHPRVPLLEAKFHLRTGMVSINCNLFHFTIHSRKIQTRGLIQVLIDAGAYRLLVTRLLATSHCQQAQEYSGARPNPSLHSNTLPDLQVSHSRTISTWISCNKITGHPCKAVKEKPHSADEFY